MSSNLTPANDTPDCMNSSIKPTNYSDMINTMSSDLLQNNANCTGTTAGGNVSLFPYVATGSWNATYASGCGQLSLSNAINQTINSMSNCIINKTNANINVNSLSTNVTKIEIVNSTINGNINITQTNITNLNTKTEVTATAITQITNNIKQILKQASKAKNTTTNGQGAGSINSSGSMSNTLALFAQEQNTTIRNIVDTTVGVLVAGTNNTTMTIDGSIINGNINIEQSNIFTIAVTTMVSQISSAIVKSSTELATTQTSEASTSVLNQGAGFGTAIPIAVIIVIIIIVMIVGSKGSGGMSSGMPSGMPGGMSSGMPGKMPGKMPNISGAKGSGKKGRK